MATDLGRDRRWDWLATPAPEKAIIVSGGYFLPDDIPKMDVPCCYGAIDGDCTCWDEVLDLPRCPPAVAVPIELGPHGGCGDCAYRADSPERRREEHVSGNPELLTALVERGAPFACHQGIARLVGWQHPTLGFWPNPHIAASYRPVEDHDGGPGGRPWPLKADGTPADICWGWAERRYHLVTGRRWQRSAPQDDGGDS